MIFYQFLINQRRFRIRNRSIFTRIQTGSVIFLCFSNVSILNYIFSTCAYSKSRISEASSTSGVLLQCYKSARLITVQINSMFVCITAHAFAIFACHCFADDDISLTRSGPFQTTSIPIFFMYRSRRCFLYLLIRAGAIFHPRNRHDSMWKRILENRYKTKLNSIVNYIKNIFI